MAESRDEVVLQQILRRESRSLLQYVHDAFPWTTAQEAGAVDRLRQLVAAEQDALAGLVRLLQRRRAGLPHLGSYPGDFTTLNYTSLDHLVPLLEKEQGLAVAQLERELAGMKDPEARELVRKLLDTKRRHLTAFPKLAEPAPATTH